MSRISERAQTPRIPTCETCGCPVRMSDKRRSVPQLRRYFALVRAAYTHWPEAHETQFSCENEFRKWLQMKAGHREVAARIPIVGMKRERALALVEASLRASGSYAIPVAHGGDIVVLVPRSIAFGRLSHLAACALFDAVADVIKAEAGMDTEQLLREQESAA